MSSSGCTGDGSTMTSSVLPSQIAGYPTEVSCLQVGSETIELVTVRGLEMLVDRERLLNDDSIEPPYWALLWSGARLLAEAVSRTGIRRGAAFLDAGCGLGLVGLTAARCGAVVTAIDRAAEPVEFVRASARRLGLDVRCRVGDVSRLRSCGRFDVIAAAELLYERSEFPRLARALSRLLAPAGMLLVADAERVPTGGFYEALSARGLVCRSRSDHRVDEEGVTVRVRVSTFARETG